MKYNFQTHRLKNKVQINIDEWEYPFENIMEIYRMSGRKYVTYITKAVTVGEGVEGIKEKDTILLSKVACDIASTPTAYYVVEGTRYFNVPQEQVIGIFHHEISLENLVLRDGYLLFEKIENCETTGLILTDKNTTMGKVIQSGESHLPTGSVILVRDNVSTPIRVNNKEFFAVEDKFVVGVIKGEGTRKVEILNEYILMKPYISSKVLNSNILITPNINYDDLDYSDINNRNLFKVVQVDSTLKNIKVGDVLLVNRDFTNYMYYNNEKYFVINEEKWISGKIIERDNDD